MNLDIDEDFATHPKSVRLCAALQNPVAWAYMIKLWSWARKYQPDGDLTGYTPEEIEFSIGWTLADGKFYAAAVRAGFIDEAPGEEARKAIHNWMQRTGGAIQRMEAGARAAKERRRNWAERERERLASAAKASASRDGTPMVAVPSVNEDDVPTVVVERRNGLTKPNPTDQIRSGSPPDLEASAPDRARSEPRAIERVGPAKTTRQPLAWDQTEPFRRCFDRYPNKANTWRAASAWQDIAAGFPGGEAALEKAIAARFDTGLLGRHPYAGEARFRPTFETFLMERRWEDPESKPDDEPAPATPTRPTSRPIEVL